MVIRSTVVALLVALGSGRSSIGQEGTCSDGSPTSPAVSVAEQTAADSQAAAPPVSEVKSASPVRDAVQPGQKPEIPYYALCEILESLRQMDLNPTPKAAVEGFYSVGSDRRQVIGEIRMAILTVSYRRFDRALGNEERLLEEDAANTLLATLTDEQKAQLRRKHRGLISQADQEAQTRAAAVHSLTWMRASTPMMNNDFLTAVEIPSVQDKLQLTDEQVAAIEQAAVEADRVAAQTSHECIDTLLKQRTPFAAASDPVSPALQKLQQVTDSVLTERQQQLYQEHMKGRHEAAQKLLASDPQKAQQLLFAIRPHGMTSESATHYERAGGAVTVVLKLTDYFATEDVAKTRGITADQQQKIADSIREAETEVQSALELTDEQKLQIETILARKPEGIRNDLIRLTAFSQTDDFEKRSADLRKQSEELVKTQEENNRRYQEHTRTQHADLWKILSEKQIKTLRQMTNLITPATSATRI